MSDYSKFGFIGGGNMGEALIKGLIASGRTTADNIMVYDFNPARMVHLAEEYNIILADGNEAMVKRCGVIVLCVKPQNMEPVLMEVGPIISEKQILISIAAGITINKLQSAMSTPVPVIRVMPNTPALVMAGATVIAPGSFVEKEQLDVARDLFESVGMAVQLEEKFMDVVTGLSGSGPAYIFVLLEAMADGAVRMGMPRDAAIQLAAQSVMGSAKLMLESGKHSGQLKDMVTSPGGTSIAGVHALEKGGFRAAVMDAIAAATRRSKELGG